MFLRPQDANFHIASNFVTRAATPGAYAPAAWAQPAATPRAYAPAARALLAATLLILSACAGSGDGGGIDGAALKSTRTQLGDTLVVRYEGDIPESAQRTLVEELSFGVTDGAAEYMFGQIAELKRGRNGDLWIFDSRNYALRMYDSSGVFLRTVGRRGNGPGEYEQANGLAILSNGHAMLWEPRVNKVRIFSAEGEWQGDWPIPGSGTFFTSGAAFSDENGNGYIRTRVGDPPEGDDPARGFMFGITGLLRYDSTGSITDSLVPPTFGVRVAALVASANGGTTFYNVPFSGTESWRWSPKGYFVGGRSDVYAITLFRPDNLLRIERDVAGVALLAEERQDAIDRVTENLRRTDPDWKWSGPEVPATKPFFKQIIVAEDGRLWVQLSTTGERIPEEERPTRVPPEGGEPVPFGPRFREGVVFDVFDHGGDFLGTVRVPPRTNIQAMSGNTVWAVVHDENDVQRVVKFRVEPALVGAG